MFVIGILNQVVIEPRRAVTFDVIDPVAGATLGAHELGAGEQVSLSGAQTLVLRGRFL